MNVSLADVSVMLIPVNAARVGVSLTPMIVLLIVADDVVVPSLTTSVKSSVWVVLASSIAVSLGT